MQVLQNFALFMFDQALVADRQIPDFDEFHGDAVAVFGTYMYTNKQIAAAYEYALRIEEAA